MYLKSLLVRFYKSFNFDFLRKFNPKASERSEWEMIDGMWYPYVRIPIEKDITVVVGENESGKSHLLDAIEKGITGKGIEREDFCRYSHFFTVELGKMKWPDFGFEWAGLDTSDKAELAAACGIESAAEAHSFLLFRDRKDSLTAYVPGHDQPKKVKTEFIDRLPNVFRLRENIGLPRSIPIRSLSMRNETHAAIELFDRQRRSSFFDSLCGSLDWFKTQQTVTQKASDIATKFSGFSEAASTGSSERDQEELQLARDLILKIAKIDSEAIQELHEALERGRDAYANSIIDEMNEALARTLNFPHWWVQDSDFQLEVSARDYDLVFTVRDRTGREYSFGERSSGLKYFLSYYIQYLAHEPSKDGRPEILLMDEPDAYLSSQGQQDLLKILDAFAHPDEGNPIQVVYVTHSPFLIDKNHAERIRVLEKGAGDEGTRVVRDASRNHYEPLRSAFGSFVGETTFMGNCNLMTEGPADQILLAGAATHLRSRGASELETLDLNHITIVPASGASHVPYLVYLARGRDVEKPAVIVMLDSDSEGENAKKGILRGGPRGKQLIDPALILQVGDLGGDLGTATGRAPVETEDLVPLSVCFAAAETYLRDVCGASDEELPELTLASIEEQIQQGGPVFKAIEARFASIGDGFHIEKLGFARCVVETVASLARREKGEQEARDSLAKFDSNMKVLFRQLRTMQRRAVRELASERVSDRLDRARDSFLKDHPGHAKREHAVVLFEEIEMALDDSIESDEIRTELQRLRREFKLKDDLTEEIRDYDQFKHKLQHLRYVGRLATQDPEPAEPQPKSPDPSSAQPSTERGPESPQHQSSEGV